MEEEALLQGINGNIGEIHLRFSLQLTFSEIIFVLNKMQK